MLTSGTPEPAIDLPPHLKPLQPQLQAVLEAWTGLDHQFGPVWAQAAPHLRSARAFGVEVSQVLGSDFPSWGQSALGLAAGLDQGARALRIGSEAPGEAAAAVFQALQEDLRALINRQKRLRAGLEAARADAEGRLALANWKRGDVLGQWATAFQMRRTVVTALRQRLASLAGGPLDVLVRELRRAEDLYGQILILAHHEPDIRRCLEGAYDAIGRSSEHLDAAALLLARLQREASHGRHSANGLHRFSDHELCVVAKAKTQLDQALSGLLDRVA